MAQERLQTLRRLAKSHHITFKPPSDEWPAAHRAKFNDIETSGSFKFDSYQEIVNDSSTANPWAKQTKARAEWLARRASRLSGQRRNEAGWRLGLENDILQRFFVEVACPNCRARVWRSEIEATLNDDSNYGQRLEQRRKERHPCNCPPESRPDGCYEIGTNPLFDDRTQEVILHNVSSTQIPKQEPDRIFGLRMTKNFEDLLSRPIASGLTANLNATLADHIRMSPFKEGSDSLLFPFLLLEAKSETSANDFDDIQVQSALPLWALLKLQEDLQSYQQENEPQWHPFVWFLANKGDTWRVYGCYSVKGENGSPTKYDIMLLWSGSLMHKDHALQLILIIDFIFDWARDIYRPNILLQLKSIATSTSFDQVSLIDSDVQSMREAMTNWIRGLPNTAVESFPDVISSESESAEMPSIMPQEHQTLLPIPIPNTSSGSVRSAFLSDFRFVSLFLTEGLARSLLWLVEARSRGNSHSPMTTTARQIVNFITQFDEVLVLTAADLNQLEETWTATTHLNNAPAAEEYYVVLEASSYLSPSWDIIREISCLAVSKSAFNHLVSVSSFVQRNKGIEQLPQKQRTCAGEVLRACIECLRSGSPWQVLLSAISCTLVAFYPLPERRRPDVKPPVEVLGLAHVRYSRVKLFIQKFLNRRGVSDWEFKRRRTNENESRAPPDLSFKRISYKRTCITEEREHDDFECTRCFQNGGKRRSPHGFLDRRIQPVLSDYHAILIVASGIFENQYVIKKLDVCLFAFDMPAELTGVQVLPVVVKDLAQAGMVYHTVHHELLYTPNREGILWNLPLPYRHTTPNERFHLENWIRELNYEPGSESDEDTHKRSFEVLQMLLFSLSIGYTYQKAKRTIGDFIHGQSYPDYYDFRKRFKSNNDSRSEMKLRGDGEVRGFTSWEEGEEHARRYTFRE